MLSGLPDPTAPECVVADPASDDGHVVFMERVELKRKAEEEPEDREAKLPRGVGFLAPGNPVVGQKRKAEEEPAAAGGEVIFMERFCPVCHMESFSRYVQFLSCTHQFH